MEKHKSILYAIQLLQQYAALYGAVLVDHWEGDLCAIGFQKDKKLIYISTYAYCEEMPLRYDVDMEDNPDQHTYNVVQELHGVSEAALIQAFSQFFSL